MKLLINSFIFIFLFKLEFIIIQKHHYYFLSNVLILFNNILDIHNCLDKCNINGV